MEGINRVIVPFIACGDLNTYDSDMTYPLNLDGKEYFQLPPTQAPIKPPYEKACDLKKRNLIQEHGLVETSVTVQVKPDINNDLESGSKEET